jgi:hypothetical protein
VLIPRQVRGSSLRRSCGQSRFGRGEQLLRARAIRRLIKQRPVRDKLRTKVHVSRRLLAFVVVLAAGAGCAATATEPVQIRSRWGPETNGLRARFQAPAEIEQNAPLAISFELQCDPKSLRAGIVRFDRFYPYPRLRLTLTNAATGRVIQLKPYDMGGPFDANRYENTVPLDGHPLKPIQAEFPLRRAGDALTPGEYNCTVSYLDLGHTRPSQRPRPKDLWTGELDAAPLRLTVKPEVLRPVTFLVPKRLRLTRDQRVVFLREDAERVTAMLGNGMYLGTTVSGDAGWLESGTPEPGGPNAIDNWHVPPHSPPPGGSAVYTIEIFATADPPHHFWTPAPGNNDYKTLWRKTFVVRQTAAQQ